MTLILMKLLDGPIAQQTGRQERFFCYSIISMLSRPTGVLSWCRAGCVWRW
jgi:hypothetical protein